MNDHYTYTDEQLMNMLNKSDQQAFTELYKRYHAGIYHYQLAFVKIPSISEDLTQEVFMKIWEARQRLHVHSSVASYIYRISRNTTIDFMKKIAADRELRNEIILHSQSFTTDNSNSQLQVKEDYHLYRQAIES